VIPLRPARLGHAEARSEATLPKTRLARVFDLRRSVGSARAPRYRAGLAALGGFFEFLEIGLGFEPIGL